MLQKNVNDGKNTVSIVRELAAKPAEEFGVSVWDVRFEKEGGSWFLRIMIDKDGGVGISDCENMSRAIDKLLDEVDPIKQQYYLEVSSAGIERELKRPEHFEASLLKKVRVRTIRPLENGAREVVGTLTGYENKTIKLETDDGEVLELQVSGTAYVKLADEMFTGGIFDE